MLCGKQTQPKILSDVCILVFIDKDVGKTILVTLQHIFVLLENRQIVQQKVTKITGIELGQAILVLLIDFMGPTISSI